MPIGSAFQYPDPKSIFSPVPRPRLLMYSSDRLCTGRASTRTFQTLFAGRLGQPAMDGGASSEVVPTPTTGSIGLAGVSGTKAHASAESANRQSTRRLTTAIVRQPQ